MKVMYKMHVSISQFQYNLIFQNLPWYYLFYAMNASDGRASMHLHYRLRRSAGLSPLGATEAHMVDFTRARNHVFLSGVCINCNCERTYDL